MPVSATWRGLVYGGEQLIAVAEDSDKAATSVDVEDLFGKTTSTLNLTSQTSANYGDRYRAILRPGGLEAVTSNSEMVFVSGTLRITQQPSSASTSSGGSASFAVTATNDSAAAISYTWQDRYNDNQFWGDIFPAETSSTLSLTNISGTQNGRQLRVVVTDADGQSVISSPAILSVRSLISITENPTSTILYYSGDSKTISVDATVDSDDPLVFIWEKLVDGVWTESFDNKSVVTGKILRIGLSPVFLQESDDGARFRVVISHPNADSVIPTSLPNNTTYTEIQWLGD